MEDVIVHGATVTEDKDVTFGGSVKILNVPKDWDGQCDFGSECRVVLCSELEDIVKTLEEIKKHNLDQVSAENLQTSINRLNCMLY